MKKLAYNQKIKFKLDGGSHAYGEGLVKICYSKCVEVELTTPCKEFDIGCMVLVDYSEILN